MAIQYSVAARNAKLDALDTAIGVSGSLEIRSGAVPATCATAGAGTVLVTINLPSPAFGNAASGEIAKNGTWEDTSADADGTALHFRIYNSQATKNETTCVAQGTVSTVAAGTGDLRLDNTSITATQTVTVSTFTITDNNA